MMWIWIGEDTDGTRYDRVSGFWYRVSVETEASFAFTRHPKPETRNPISAFQTFGNALKTLHPPLRRRARRDVGEEVLQVVAGDAPEAEDFDARRVDDGAAEIEGIPPRRGRRVHAF